MAATRIEMKQEFRYSIRSQQVLTAVFICSVTILILMTVCLMSSYWITASGFRQGLLYLCIDDLDFNSRTINEPLPFDLNKEQLQPGCYPNRDVGYLKICTFFCLVTQLSALATAILSCIGIRVTGIKRDKCMRYSIFTLFVTLVCDITLLVIYPTQFRKEIDKSNRDLWELNGAFGLACGSAILTCGALMLLLVAIRRNVNIYEATPTRI